MKIKLTYEVKKRYNLEKKTLGVGGAAVCQNFLFWFLKKALKRRTGQNAER